jgi:WD40 repeat protein
MMHQGRVLSARFNPNGTQVVAAAADKTARLWEVPPLVSDNQDLLADLAGAVSGSKLNEFGVIETLENSKEQLSWLCRQTANAFR